MKTLIKIMATIIVVLAVICECLWIEAYDPNVDQFVWSIGIMMLPILSGIFIAVSLIDTVDKKLRHYFH